MDRFHFQGHTCCSHFNHDSYTILMNQQSVAAEVINAVINNSSGFIRHLKVKKIKPHLRILLALHNFTSMIKDNLSGKELPMLDLGKLYNCRFELHVLSDICWKKKKPGSTAPNTLFHSCAYIMPTDNVDDDFSVHLKFLYTYRARTKWNTVSK